MAAQFKGICKYHALEAGWSEIYWLRGPDMNTAIAQLQSINTARMALSQAAVVLDDVVVIDATTPRVATHPALASGWTLAGSYNPAGGTSTVTPDLAILVRMFDAVGLRRSRVFVRGFPADQFASGVGGPDALFTYTTGYTANMNAYINALIANALLVHKSAPHLFTVVPIDHCAASLSAHLRRAGRPFFLRRGRRRIA